MIYGYIRKHIDKQMFVHMKYKISQYATKHDMKIDI